MGYSDGTTAGRRLARMETRQRNGGVLMRRWQQAAGVVLVVIGFVAVWHGLTGNYFWAVLAFFCLLLGGGLVAGPPSTPR